MPADKTSNVDEVTTEPEPAQPEQGSRERRGADVWASLAAVLLAAIVLLVLLTQCVPRVPDVVGLPEQQAANALTRAGYEVGTLSKVALPDTLSGKVAEQAPEAGAVFSRGTTVDLVIALGADLVEVPDVVGDDTPAAELLIEGKRLIMKVSGQYSDTIPPGAVISQSPPAGTKVPVGTQVVVVVSLGIAPETGDVSGASSAGEAGTSDDGSGSGSSTSLSSCTARYPNATVWSSGGDVFIRLTPGGGTRRLTSGSPWDTDPILSPSSKFVVFLRAPSKSARSNQLGRVCLTDFDVAILGLPISRPDTASTIYYSRPVFAPGPNGTAPGSDWLVTPQYMTEAEVPSPGTSARLMVTNVPIDSTWVSWNIAFRPIGSLTLSRSSKAGSVRVTGSGAPKDFNVYTGLYNQ